MNVNNVMADLERKHPGESEYLQAVREVLESIEEVYNDHPEFEKAKIVERMVEPDRIITFRVTWVDDAGEIQTNIGYVKESNHFKTFEEAYNAMCKWDNIFERIITPVMKGYVKE